MSEHCILCQEPGFEPVFSYTEPDSYERKVGVKTTGYYRRWVKCVNCGFVYSQYSRPPEQLDQIYADAYRDQDADWRAQSVEENFARIVALPASESESHPRISWIKEQLNDLTQAGILALPAGGKRLLDIGGGSGVFAYLFQDTDWQCEIVDPSRQGRFMEKRGIRYHACAFADLKSPHLYHLASFVFVLEHLLDPIGMVRQARDLLEDAGAIYIEVPDAVAIAHQDADHDAFNACHLWLFDPASLAQFCRLTGLELLALRRTRTLRGYYSLQALLRAKR